MEESKLSSGLVSPALLDKIDKLFACNAGEYVDLPQIVVVGDQSSGKSSVLEGFTGLPFPRDSGLCTRFATQITFRRSPQRQVSAAIIPAKNSTENHREQAQAWAKAGLQTLDAKSFADIMEEVRDIMGVGGADGETRSTFSEDVLRLEISGPDQEHFSVIDVPGIFKRVTHGVTTKSDMDLVNRMVCGYMSNPRSVMLAVIPCNVDIATQEILQRAEEMDPEGIRTLGVLTKPDLVDKGAERAVLDLLKGEKHQLRLGWHLLRNPGQADLENQTRSRHAIEKDFFAKTAPWNGIEEDKVGIGFLRARLQEILAGHIRREFPKVKSEISQRLKAASNRLASLGPRRQTPSEQRQFVMEIALEFQQITAFAVGSDYVRSDLFDEDPTLRLATAAINRAGTFADMMATEGHVFHFTEDDQDRVSEDDPLNTEGVKTLTISDDKSADVRIEADHPDVEDLIHENRTVSKPLQGRISAWLDTAHSESRGFELGTFKPSLLAVVMKRQAHKWRDLALGYISDIIVMVHSFITKLLDHVTPTENVRAGIASLLMDELRKKYQAAITHVNFLLEVELMGNPATHNHYFNDALEKSRQDRLRHFLEDKTLSDCKHGKVVRLDDIAQDHHPLSNKEHTIREIHDILKSYYKLARERFVDCVRIQVADHYLVTGKDTPLTLFSPTFVACMTPEQLEEVAGEDVPVKRKRAQLEKEIRQLEEARRILT